MTQKEIANRLREIAGSLSYRSPGKRLVDIRHLADEIDPPRPEPGTVVWWRGLFFGASTDWELGQAALEGVYAFACESWLPWHDVDWRPAHILAPDEVAVTREDAERADAPIVALQEVDDE